MTAVQDIILFCAFSPSVLSLCHLNQSHCTYMHTCMQRLPSHKCILSCPGCIVLAASFAVLSTIHRYNVAGQEGHPGKCVQACPQLETCRTCTGLGWPTALQRACAVTATPPQGHAFLCPVAHLITEANACHQLLGA